MDKIILSEDRYGRKTDPFADDDFVDRLNNKITITLLVACILIITSSIYVGKPINCWTPGIFILNRNIFLLMSFSLNTIQLNSKDSMMGMQIVFVG